MGDEHNTTDPADRETGDRILDAAHEVFLQRGTAGARMQEIADVAGVNKALLHYYYRSKDRLAEAVFQRAARLLMPPVVSTLLSDLPLEEKVERAIGLYLASLSRTPGLPIYLLSEMHHHPDRLGRLIEKVAGGGLEWIAPRIFARLAEQIDEQVRAGRMRPMAPEQFVINLASLCVFPFAARPLVTAALGGTEGWDRFLEERRETLAAFFLAGLRP
jgi:TetR/AcrR family transcriptional regulator